ncbi:hypothetical protein F0562_028214 [Nyssa sinensis]|uniref:Receptor-like serine/threonine-protein kinase n=1 Tax=Nyssa sinensis TaxID=561372 RepID=A0A5J5B9G9_9ASTE|nr:hypothetical protein F0562_028214 [Nyssa sinensis]
MKSPSLILSIFLSLLFFFFIIISADISPGSTLYASNPDQNWTSPNNTFSLGFITEGTSCFAAITYNGIPIWKAGGAMDSSASLQFLSDGNLRLVNGSGFLVWQSNTAGHGVSSAVLEDSGNFVLRNGNVSIWSTFDNPTDTIVPSQNFTTGKVLRSGLYSFALLSSGNLTLRWGMVLLCAVNIAYTSDYAEGSDVLRFLRLDSDGNLRIYSSVRNSGTSNVRWSAVGDQCQVFGYCGNMGICSYNDSSPICGCPSRNFDPIDPTDSRKGCKRKVEIENCPGRVTMLPLDHANFLTYPPELDSQLYTLGISACRSNCHSPALPSTSFVKVCGPVQPNLSPSSVGLSKKNDLRLNAWIVTLVVSGTILGFIMFEGGLWWWCCRNSSKFWGLSAQYALREYASGMPVHFSYKELQRSTKGFKEKLGAGGFGAVYRGVLANRTIIAVKQLEDIEQGEKQFRMEVVTISSTHHLNLVRLIGFCSEGRHRLLVYEFMKSGSLDNFLFTRDEQSGRLLNWEYRFKIALGTAKGITYLHEECRECIVHCDIKPENILLDENYNAKVSDFGLAKLINPKDHTYRTLKSVWGTRGYLAPEWLANLPINSKSDVYSYGMVLLEIVSGRRNFEVSEETNQKKLSFWAYEEFEKGNVKGIVDKRLANHEVDMEQVMRAIQVSFWCIQEQPSQRPMMGKVVQMLEGITKIERPSAPKAMTEGSVNGTGSVSALSTFATSALARSSSS